MIFDFTNTDAKTLEGHKISEFVTNENLVINPNFRIGAADVTDATGTKIVASKWYIGSNATYSVKVTEEGLRLSQSVVGGWCNLEQNVDITEDGIYTISFWCDKPENINQVGFNSTKLTVEAGNGFKFTVDGNMVYNTYKVSNISEMRLFIQQKNELCDFTVKWVKLERGAVATPYVTPKANMEKLKGGVTVGDAQTLNGLDSTAFLKTTGGTVADANNTPLGVKNTAEDVAFIKHIGKTEDLGSIGFARKDLPVYRTTDGATQYALHHDGNSAKVVINETAPSDTSALWVY